MGTQSRDLKGLRAQDMPEGWVTRLGKQSQPTHPMTFDLVLVSLEISTEEIHLPIFFNCA